MKHTPGPWEADRGFIDAGDTNYHYTIDDEFMTVYCGRDAIDNFDPEVHDYIEIHGPNQEANAQAIEALPELLEALEGLTEELEKIEAWDGDCPWLIPFVRQARAVINKTRRQGV